MTTKIEEILLDAERDGGADFIPLISDGDDSFEFKEGENEALPLLALRNMVLFPGVVMPVTLGREKSLKAVRNAYKKGLVIGVFSQKDEKVEMPTIDDLYQVGTVAQVMKVLEMPDGTSSAILQGKRTITLDAIVATTPYLKGNVSPRYDVVPLKTDKEFVALLGALRDVAMKIVKASSSIPNGAVFAIKNIEHPVSLVNFICANFGLKVEERQMLLDLPDLKGRGFMLLEILNRELQMLELKLDIQSKTQEGIEQQQREYYLQQQMKTIQQELGGDAPQEIERLKERAAKKKWDASVKEIFDKEIARLERTPVHSPDYGVQLNYVETILNLPWNEYSKDSLNLKSAQKILDRDHFGLEKVKERILEHLAVLKLKKELKSPIICLYGPPGVGKTSLGKSVAEALKRKYVRISLGGLSDESEIRGHRRTYIGAMPGRIIQSLQKAGTSNPVFILDEIDKVSSDYKGDPAAALLEVLDPEQNNAFHDNYLDIDYDLSKVMFIATANNLNSISQPLLDRMEIIEVSGYLLEEKVEIAARHLIPKEMENHGIESNQISIGKDTLVKMVEGYTRESGVRELDKQITKIMRKAALKIAAKEEFDPAVTPENLSSYLGIERFSKDKYEGNDYAGVVTGLAWTAVGGEILFVESCLSKSKTPKLTLTGNLGDVMKESAILALEYLRCHADDFGIDSNLFDEYSVHVHVPEGAIPKDGPSAGVTITTSLASSFTKRKVRKNLAMTGEITLRGKVLPVGGIKEKILAAKRAGITDIMLCKENRKDIEEIKDLYVKGLTFHYVENIKDVLDFALLDEKVEK